MGASNLPTYPTPFVGRHDELAEITRLLGDPACRLLTLTGPGGIGKTRLAQEAARQVMFPNGVHFVPLQPLTSPDFMVSAIADSIGFQFYSGTEPKQQLLDFFREKSMLLIMDNLEHLLDGVQLLSEILSAAPYIRILATSRERLNLVEEWVLDVHGLPFPSSEAEPEIEDYSAVQLFIQNARRAQVGFSLTDEHKPAITRICRLLDGMPLGIELAAAWVRVMPSSEIAREIEHSLDILTTSGRNVPEKHRSMRTVFEHSWNLLTDNEQAVFRKLSVFRGGFTRDAAEQVAGASLPTLAALVDKSMLRVNASGRYDLHELLRQHGEEKLKEDATEWVEANECHCRYYAEFLERRTPHLKGNREIEALKEIEIELENVRAYWEWAVSHQKEAEIEAALDSLWIFYDTGCRFQEGEQAFGKAASTLRANATNLITRLLVGKVLARHGALIFSLDLIERSEMLLKESLDILHDFDAPEDLAFCLLRLGIALIESGNLESQKLFQTSLTLYREIGDWWGIGKTLLRLEYVYAIEGNLQQALEVAQESLAVFTHIDNQHGIATSNQSLAWVAISMSDYRAAHQLAQKCLVSYQELGIVWEIEGAYRVCGWAALGLGEYAEARQAAHQALTIAAKYHLMRHSLFALRLVAQILLAEGKADRGLELLGLVDEMSIKMGKKFSDLAELLSKLESDLSSEQFTAAVQRGRVLDFDKTVKEILDELEHQTSEDAGQNAPAQPLADPLTERELEILRLVAQGLSNREIARELFVSLGTVKTHIHNICSKLDATSRTQAIARARELKLLA